MSDEQVAELKDAIDCFRKLKERLANLKQKVTCIKQIEDTLQLIEKCETE